LKHSTKNQKISNYAYEEHYHIEDDMLVYFELKVFSYISCTSQTIRPKRIKEVPFQH